MSVTLRQHQPSLQSLRDSLIHEDRGATGAFKDALGDAVHYWRNHYAPLHFRNVAFNRYPNYARAKYARNKPHGPGTVGSGQASVRQVVDKLGRSWYSDKEARQVRAGMAVDNSPMVFSGLTREGIVNGAFRVRGSSKAVRGSWNDGRINWRALSARGGQLRHYLLTVNANEWAYLEKFIEKTFFRFLEDYVRKGRRLPPFTDLPIHGK